MLPNSNAVIAINSGSFDMQRIMNIAWERLLPAFSQAPLAEDAEAHGRLQAQLRRLSIPIPQSQGEGAGRARWLGRRWEFIDNPLGVESLSLTQEGNDSLVSISVSGRAHHVRSSATTWVRGETELELGAPLLGAKPVPHRIAASKHRTDENATHLRIAYTETPRLSSLELLFGDKALTVSIEHSGSFAAGEIAPLVGAEISL